MAENEIKAELKRLKNLIKFMITGMPKVKVGIIGDTNARTKGTLTNAEIGFANEFGKMTGGVKIPPRSFIRMPLNLFLQEKLKQKKSLSKEAFEKAVDTGETVQFAEKVGLVAEEVIQEAFATRGFGNWKPNAPLTVALKKSDSPLIDTGQLRRAITSKVIK